MEKRIRFKRGKQKLIIEDAKRRTGTWKELSSILNCNESYLKNELRNEKNTLSDKMYESMCKIASKRCDIFILEKLDKNWGRKKGTRLSPRTKPLDVKRIEPSEKLAEIIGIMLGDGNVYRKQYAVRVCGHIRNDETYLMSTVKKLFRDVFGVELKGYRHEKMNELILYTYSKFVVKNLEEYGIESGNKKINGCRIPEWILRDEKCITACVRGLFDTDGCVFKRNGKLKIELYSGIGPLRESFLAAMKKLGFDKEWKRSDRDVKTYGLYSERDVKRFINIVNFNNPKHIRKASMV